MILNDNFESTRVMKQATGLDKEKIMKLVGNILSNLDLPIKSRL